MNYIWIVEEQGYEDKWYPCWNLEPFSNREDARNAAKFKRDDWSWNIVRVKKYVRVD